MTDTKRRSDVQSNPHKSPAVHDKGQIIFMGDVRRRSRKQRQAPDRHYIGAIALVALAAWSVWITVVFSLQPARLLTYLAFFLPLGVALAASSALAAYGMEWRQGRIPSLRVCIRRGTIFAGLVVLNLAFQAAHRWSLVIGGLGILLALAAEGAALRRTLS